MLVVNKKASSKHLIKPNKSVVIGGFEPPTHGFSVRCSTN